MSAKPSAARPGGQTLPSAAPPGRPQLVFARDDTAGSDKRPGTPERILVVEDDFLVAMQMESALVEAGFEVAGIAATGEADVHHRQLRPFADRELDCVLAGDRDGIDTALQLFAEQGIRCIFATAHHDEQSRARAAPAVPLGWLHKPYTMVSLVGMVRSALAELDKGGR